MLHPWKAESIHLLGWCRIAPKRGTKTSLRFQQRGSSLEACYEDRSCGCPCQSLPFSLNSWNTLQMSFYQSILSSEKNQIQAREPGLFPLWLVTEWKERVLCGCFMCCILFLITLKCHTFKVPFKSMHLLHVQGLWYIYFFNLVSKINLLAQGCEEKLLPQVSK